ncbi:hypothetical protein M0813_15928 [Anaeramoeba flamelloides]|uniref:Uncharacterized protein n=1 Tax=Anaeramoeba flamelloides TaxID=1746091 RepID=A0ABQ8Z0N4_9EUKA|nr:hypothetical protein M0813_15928 [Anaeramoeba flamelloides]
MGGHKFGVDQDEILIINVIKRIGWFWGGRAKRVHPKIPNSFDNINNNNFFYPPPSGMNELFKEIFEQNHFFKIEIEIEWLDVLDLTILENVASNGNIQKETGCPFVLIQLIK